MLNHKIIKTADEMLNIIDNSFNIDEINETWKNSKLLFSLLLSQTQTEKIKTAILNLKNDDNIQKSLEILKDEFSGICDSMKLNIENIL